MKNKILFLFIFVLFIQAQASGQTYTLGYYHNNLLDYDCEVVLSVSTESSKRDQVMIGFKPLHSEHGFLFIRLEKLDSFVKSLKKLKSKALEWSKVVNEQNIIIEKKEMNIKFPEVDFGWGNNEGRFHFAFYQTPNFYFSSREGGYTKTTWDAIVHTKDYEYMEGFVISFISIDEYDRLLELLDVKKIKEIAKKRHKELDLLK